MRKRSNDEHTRKNTDRATHTEYIQQHKHNVQMHSVTKGPENVIGNQTNTAGPYIVTSYFIPSFINRLVGHVYRSTLTAAAMIIISFRQKQTTTKRLLVNKKVPKQQNNKQTNKKHKSSGKPKGPQTTRTHRRDYTNPRR